MKEPQKERDGCFGSAVEELLTLFGQLLILPIFIGYFVVCLWLLDHFHVSNPDTQLAFVLAPIMLSGLVVVVRLLRKR